MVRSYLILAASNLSNHMRSLLNQTYGFLRVIRPGKPRGRRRYWICRCEARYHGKICGTIKEVRSDSLRVNGGMQSCGWLRIETVKALGHHHARGERFSRLVVVRQSGVIPKRGRVYLCLCDCGRRVKVQGRFLRDGLIKSCGCWYRASRTLTTKHAQARSTGATGTYRAYQRQRSLCSNPNGRLAQYFHDRGVQFRFDNFQDFYAEIGAKPGPDFWLVRFLLSPSPAAASRR